MLEEALKGENAGEKKEPEASVSLLQYDHR